MSELAHELTIVEQDEDAALAALQALTPRFQLEPSGTQRIRRTWLDTFDWRLHGAGLVLEDREAAGEHRLTLTSTTGEQLSCVVGALRWPSVIDGLPASPLRERLARVAGIRALLPVAEAQSRVQQVRVLNDDAKTVARIELDRPSLRGRSPGGRSTHVSVRPLRGYGSEGDRIVRMLSGVAGVDTGAESIYELALAAADRRPEDYAGKVDIPLSPAMPAATAVAIVLETFVAALEANVAGVIADVDTEFLHDFRVAVRRTRATLKLTGDSLPGSIAERFAPAFKWLGDLTTPTRDLDVFVLGFDAMAADLQAASVSDLDPLRAHLVRQREIERRRLARGLKSRRFEQLLSDWRAELAGVMVAGPDASTGPTAKHLAEERMKRAYRGVVKRGSAINAGSPADDLHTLRKRCKELRYLLEIFSSLHDPDAHRRVLRELKALQECLGDFQDSEVQRLAVSEFATQLMEETTVPTETILAIGELAARLDTRKRAARNDYANRWDRFTSRKNRLAIAQLTGAVTA